MMGRTAALGRLALLLVLAQWLAASAPGTQAISRPDRRAVHEGYPIKVYFSRHPASDSVYGAVVAVRRVSPTLGVATYAMGQLLVGPTAAEARAGYYTEFTLYYHGPSTCGPAGFTIRLNHRGGAYEPGTATVQLCRRLRLPGLGASARMTAEVSATLRQFPSIRRVVILTANGTCFGDESGEQRCLRRHL